MNRNAAIIICSRPESKRLPNKVFKKIAGVPVIEHILNRVSNSGLPIILAVPEGCNDYNHLAKRVSFLYKGSGDSPLHRMAQVANLRQEKWFVRITHDDILIDTQTMLGLIDGCEETVACGYGYSPSIVEGAGVEVIRRENLLKAAEDRKEPTEFISYFVKDKPYSKNVIFTPRKEVCRPYRLTLDYPEDGIVLETLLRELGPDVSLDKICEFLDKHPYLLRLNFQPKVSIYTCAYNAESYIERTMDSILAHNQGEQFEYIFVDDGSKDSTLLKASRYGHDKRIKYLINETNQGLASSSNIALSVARGAYVMRVDADDLLFTNAISETLNIIESEKSSIVYPSFKEINEKEEIISSVISGAAYHHAGCALMDKRMINEVRFTNGLKHWDSKDLYNRIKNKFKISYAQDPLWLYRKHSKSLSAQKTPERMEALQKIA